MTKEGIIQKVFKKYYTNGFDVDIDDNTVSVIPTSTLEDAFKELIAEIPNIIDSEYGNAHINVLQRLKDKLIGDIE